MLAKYAEAIDQWTLGLRSRKFSDEEIVYLYARVQESRARMCDVFALIGICFDIVLWLVKDFVPQDTVLWQICQYSYLLAAIWLMTKIVRASRWKQIGQGVGSLVTSVLCAWLIVDLAGRPIDPYSVYKGFILSYVIVVGAFVILMAWVSRPMLALITSFSLVFSWNLPEFIDRAPNRFVACAFILILPILNHALHLRQLRVETREMLSRLSTMPRRLALSLDNRGLSPRQRFCICLSSDWRGYQDLVSGISDQKVVSLLEDYYGRVQKILGRQLQEFDHYMDWIADELFVVVYSDATDHVDLQARQHMIRKVLECGQFILKMKDEFSSDHQLDLGIDIGLSLGQSLIGVIGPTEHRKATAMGSNPGRARRMQGCGKLLRNQVSNLDRIIFGDEVLMALQTPTLTELNIGVFNSSSFRLRNLEDKNLFFVTTQERDSAERVITKIAS